MFEIAMSHADGEVYSVGSNSWGQLGLDQVSRGSNAVAWGKVTSASAGWGSAPVTMIAAGPWHSFVVAGVASFFHALSASMKLAPFALASCEMAASVFIFLVLHQHSIFPRC